jgi:hypothetical protein
MKTIDEVLKNNINGLYYGNRVLLPFKADILKAVIEKDIITDFSSTHKDAQYNKTESFTEIYFLDYKELSEYVTKYETIKLIVVEEGKDIFDFNNHKRLILHLKEKHILKIEEATGDILLFD